MEWRLRGQLTITGLRGVGWLGGCSCGLLDFERRSSSVSETRVIGRLACLDCGIYAMIGFCVINLVEC